MGHRLYGERQSEGGALALLRCHQNVAMEQGSQFLHDGEAQSHTLNALRLGEPGEGVKHPARLLLSHAQPRVGHRDGEAIAACGRLDGDAALGGVLKGVAHQIVNDLLDAEGVATQPLLGASLHVAHHPQALGHGLRAYAVGTFAHKAGCAKGHGMRLHVAALQPMVIEQGGDEVEQMGGRLTNVLHIRGRLGVATHTLVEQLDES